jgi:hypothetical protein
MIALILCSGCRTVVELEPEQQSTVRVGTMAAIRVETARHFSIGHGGQSLALVKHADEKGATVYVYRAVAPGQQTFVLTPRELGPDGCISCVTVHYFVDVVK